MTKKIEDDQIFLTSKWDNWKFHYQRGKGHLLSYLKNRIQWYWFPPLGVVAKFPPHVDIEISSECNMQCPMCYRRTEQFQENVPIKLMDEELFKKIIDECTKHKLFSIRLSFRGEPFVHPQIFDFIKLAKDKGIKEISCLTNCHALTPEGFEKLVQAGFDWLTMSIDGLGEAYEAIRQPAKSEEVIEKVKRFSEIKKRYKSSKPALRVQTIWPAVKDNPRVFYDIFAPHVDSITSNPLIDFKREDEDIEYEKDFQCPYLYQRFVIGSDGRALLCICDEMGEHVIGDLNNETIYDIWHGDKMKEARGWFEKGSGKEWWKDNPCKYCYYPRKQEVTGDIEIDGHKVKVKKYVNRDDAVDLGDQG